MNYTRIIRFLTIVCTSDCLVRFKFNRQPLNQLEYCLYKMKKHQVSIGKYHLENNKMAQSSCFTIYFIQIFIRVLETYKDALFASSISKILKCLVLTLIMWLSHVLYSTEPSLLWLYVISAYTPVSSTNKTDPRDITEILLKVALHNIALTQTSRLNTTT